MGEPAGRDRKPAIAFVGRASDPSLIRWSGVLTNDCFLGFPKIEDSFLHQDTQRARRRRAGFDGSGLRHGGTRARGWFAVV